MEGAENSGGATPAGPEQPHCAAFVAKHGIRTFRVGDSRHLDSPQLIVAASLAIVPRTGLATVSEIRRYFEGHLGQTLK